jgi:N-terminal domain of anti-restriction factor ArdC
MEATPNLSAVHSASKAVQSRTEELRQEALTRAISGQTMSNYPAIFQGFMAKGIPESEIRPRENVFTFNAWRALGRTVRRGEHGVKVLTFIDRASKEIDRDTGEPKVIRLAWNTTVFHVSQTEAINGGGR